MAQEGGGKSGDAARDVDIEKHVPASEPTRNGAVKVNHHSIVEDSDQSAQVEVAATDDPPIDMTDTEVREDIQLGKGRVVIVMFSLGMAVFLAALDITIVATALPTIAGHFHASSSNYTWIGGAYVLANSAAIPLWGKFSDIWGRKPLILLANVIFMVGSLVAAVSGSIGTLIGGRIIQGVGGGGLLILVNICIADLFSMRERPKYYGIIGMVWAIASGVGPIVGGAFTQKVSWRWNFYINLPLDGVSFILLTLFLKLETPKEPFVLGIKAIDWLGVVCITGGTVMFLLGMEGAGVTQPWDSAYTLCLIIFGVLTMGLFVLVEWKVAKYPVIPLRLFTNTTILACLGVTVFHGFVSIAEYYYLPLYFQTVLSAGPILSGVYVFPLVLSLSFSSAVSGLVIKKTGRYREPIWFGLCMMTLGTGLFIDLGPTANWAKIIVFQIVAGIGLGPNYQGPLIALQSQVRGHDIAVGTATFGFARQLSTSISIILGGVILQNELAKQKSTLEAALGESLASQIAHSSFGSTTDELRRLPAAQKAVFNHVFASSMRKIWIFYTALAGAGLAVSVFIGTTVLSKTHEKTRVGIAEQERVRQERLEQRRQRAKVTAAVVPDPEKAAELDLAMDNAR